MAIVYRKSSRNESVAIWPIVNPTICAKHIILLLHKWPIKATLTAVLQTIGRWFGKIRPTSSRCRGQTTQISSKEQNFIHTCRKIYDMLPCGLLKLSIPAGLQREPSPARESVNNSRQLILDNEYFIWTACYEIDQYKLTFATFEQNLPPYEEANQVMSDEKFWSSGKTMILF